MRIVTFSDVRNRLESVLDQMVEDSDYTVISRRDAEDAVVMSLDHFNGLMETVHLLRSPANAAHLAKSIDQYKRTGRNPRTGETIQIKASKNPAFKVGKALKDAVN